MTNENYTINGEDFKKIYEMVQEIHGNISIIKNFCKDFQTIDEFYKIMPLMDYTLRKTDILFCKFIELS